MKLLNIKTILKNSNFVKKDGVGVFMIVLHFVYMLVMNQSQDSLKKDVYYRLLKNPSYNWRKLLSLTNLKILKLLHKVQDVKAIKVFIIDDTVEGKMGKQVEENNQRY